MLINLSRNCFTISSDSSNTRSGPTYLSLSDAANVNDLDTKTLNAIDKSVAQDALDRIRFKIVHIKKTKLMQSVQIVTVSTARLGLNVQNISKQNKCLP